MNGACRDIRQNKTRAKDARTEAGAPQPKTAWARPSEGRA